MRFQDHGGLESEAPYQSCTLRRFICHMILYIYIYIQLYAHSSSQQQPTTKTPHIPICIYAQFSPILIVTCLFRKSCFGPKYRELEVGTFAVMFPHRSLGSQVLPFRASFAPISRPQIHRQATVQRMGIWLHSAGAGVASTYPSQGSGIWALWLSLLLCLASPASALPWSGTHLSKRSLTEAAKSLGGVSRVMPMAKYPDPMLRMSARPVEDSMFHKSELQLFTEALKTTAATEGAVGLAASQLGVDARIIVLDPTISERTIFINPTIIERSSESNMRWWRERCLVLPPDVLVTLLRDARIKVEASDINGNVFSQIMEGEAARAFQHELDHLNGVLIIDHALEEEDLTSKDTWLHRK